jgi:arylsulfatase A-like enzyme
MFEGGVNVPFFMKWKGILQGGTVFKEPVSSMDIFMTSARLGKCLLPEDRVYDGVDLMPYLTGKDQGIPHKDFYWKADHIRSMRMGDWKYIQSVRDGWVELYNLREDRYERINLLKVRPDELEQLMKVFDQWNKEMVLPLWPRIMDYKIIIDGKEYLFPA